MPGDKLDRTINRILIAPTNPTSPAPTRGTLCRLDTLVAMTLQARDSDGLVLVDFDTHIWWVTVSSVAGNPITPGEMLYYHDGASGVDGIVNNSNSAPDTGYALGRALEAIADGATAEIKVLLYAGA